MKVFKVVSLPVSQMSEMAEGKLIAAIAFLLLFAQHLVTEKKAQGKKQLSQPIGAIFIFRISLGGNREEGFVFRRRGH